MTVETLVKGLSRQIDELRKTQEVHSDVLGIANGYHVIEMSRLRGITEILREVLSRQGMNKEAVAKLCDAAFAKHFAVVQSENVRALDSIESSRPPSASGPEAEKT